MKSGVPGALLTLLAVEKSMTLAPSEKSMFWSNGNAWGVCRQSGLTVELTLHHGSIELETFASGKTDVVQFESPLRIVVGETVVFDVK